MKHNFADIVTFQPASEPSLTLESTVGILYGLSELVALGFYAHIRR